jgi:protein O-mannosyl-transferase
MPKPIGSNSSDANSRIDFWICLFITIAIVTIYAQVRHFAFLNFDDPIYVLNNHYVKTGKWLESMAWAFRLDNGLYWHPLAYISHMLDHHIYGINPGRHHMVNLLIHELNALSLFLVLRVMTGASWRSGLVAMLFAIHPMNVESVAWIAERKNLLCTLFFFLTVITYIHYTRRPGIPRYMLALSAFVFGLMTKPMLVTLPFVLLLIDYWPLKRTVIPRPTAPFRPAHATAVFLVANRRLLMEKIPFLLLSLCTMLLSIIALNNFDIIHSTSAIPMTLRLQNALVSYVKYILKLFYPMPFSIIHPFPQTIPIWKTIIAASLLLFITIVVIRSIRSRPWFSVGWFWFLGTLFPMIGLVQTGLWPEMADRYTYLPFIGLFIILAWELPHGYLFRSSITKGATLAAVVCVITGYGMIAFKQTGFWENNLLIFRQANSNAPLNYVVQNNLGLALEERGHFDAALHHYQKALEIYPGDLPALNGIGLVLLGKGQLDEAIRHYTAIIKKHPRFATAYVNIGMAHSRKGQLAEAIRYYTQSIEINPNNDNVQNNMGNALFQMGRLNEAILHYTKAIQLNPSNVFAYNNLGSALVKKGMLQEARHMYSEALRLDPSFSLAKQNLSKIQNHSERKVEIPHHEL